MADSLVDRIVRRQKWMDGFAGFVQKLVGGTYRAFGPFGRGLRNLAHGSKPLGHPLHPAVTDLPMGAWLTAVVLDIVAHYNSSVPRGAAEVALFVGIIAAVLAAITGYTDFYDTFGHERRIALTHGLTMSVVLLLMLISEALRHWGASGVHSLAVGLSFAGALLMLLGGYLGGHLVFGMGTMVNRDAFFEGVDKFTDVGASTEFPDGDLRRVMAGDLPVLVVRREGKLCAIGAVCSHAGGPLDEGKLENGRITCPWHGSQFDICSGAVKGGPATFAQPALDIREADGRVAVKRTVSAHRDLRRFTRMRKTITPLSSNGDHATDDGSTALHLVGHGHPIDHAAAERAVTDLLAALGEDPAREELRETPRRVVEAFAEMTTRTPFRMTTFPNSENYNELVVVRDIPFHSLCEHHLLPFVGVAHVGYIPASKLVGLSKMARVVEHCARSLQVQERMTAQIAEYLDSHLSPIGVGVVLEAEHFCMSLRGVNTPGTRTVTSELRGAVSDDARTRQEFLALAGVGVAPR